MNNDEFIRLQRDVVDGYDAELELELGLEDRPFDADGTKVALSEADKQERRQYFRKLLRLQGELACGTRTTAGARCRRRCSSRKSTEQP